MSGFYSSNWMGVPYSMPNMNWGQNWFSPVGSASSVKKEDKKPMTYEEFHKKWLADKEAKDVLEQQIKQTEDAKKADAEIIKKGKNGKINEDNTITIKETKEEFKKLTGWQKIKRGFINTLDGALECGMDMFGIEGFLPPKVNFKKLGSAVAGIGAIALATCIPVVGPFVIPAAVTVGLTLGAGKVAVGTVKACKADNPEDFDKATKGIGEGAVIAGLSWSGIRAQGGFMAMYRNAKSIAASQSFFNMAAWKNGFSNLVKPVKNFFSAKHNQVQFRSDVNNVQRGIDKQIREFDNQIASAASDAKKGILEHAKKRLIAQKEQLNDANKMTDWAKIKHNSEAKNEVKNLKDVIKTLKKGEPISAGTDAAGNDIVINATKENIELLKTINKQNETLAKQVSNLADKKNSLMRRMVLNRKGKASVKSYTGSDSKLGQFYNLVKPNIDWGWNLLYKAPWFAIKESFAITIKPYNWFVSLTKKGVTVPYNIQQTVAPQMEAGFISGLLTGFGACSFLGGEKLLTTVVSQKDESGNAVQQSAVVTKDLLAQLEEEQKKYDETIKQLKEEERKLGLS